MPAELPKDAVRIRNLYPIMKCDRAIWKRIIALCRAGGSDDITAAEDLARACTQKTSRTRSMHVGALRKRIMRRAFLVQQKKDEGPILDALKTLADRVDTILNRESRDGVIPQSRYRAAVEAILDRNKEAYADIAKNFQAALRSSVKIGLIHSMRNAEAVVGHAKNARESAAWANLEADYRSNGACVVVPLDEVDPLKQQLTYAPSTSVFKKLFKGALKDTMTAGLFGGKRVSARVWDLRDGNAAQMKRLLAAGIARGDDPATISRAIRGILVQPKTLRGAARADATPGAGVYRSAYANAMRLTRTETNRAYILSDTLFAEDKGWNLIWTVSTGQREEDECDDLGGREMTPEEFADNYPVHPQCLLPGNEVLIPDVVAGAKSFYEGWAVEIRLPSGRKLSATENHPILTPRGWVAAKFLREGDEVLTASNPKRIAQTINPDHDHRPALVEQVFDTLRMASGSTSSTMKPTSEDFHGDARRFNGHVHVVRADRFLGRYREAFTTKESTQIDLGRRDVRHAELARGGNTASVLKSLLLPTHGRVGGRGHAHAIFPRGMSVVESLGCAVAADLNAHGDKPLAEISSTDLERTREFKERFSREVESVHIVHVRRRFYSGHVYDLQADVFGLYISNGFLVKNCLCYSVLAPKTEFDSMLSDTPKQEE